MVDQAKLELLGADEMAALKPRDKDDVLETVEAVIAPDSLLIGNTPQDLRLRQNYEVNLLALSRAGEPTIATAALQPLRTGRRRCAAGPAESAQSRADGVGLLPLAERNLAIGRPRRRWMPLLILLAALIAIATSVVAVEVGFFVAATLIVLLRLATPREAYDAVEWPIIVMLGCLIPVGEALKDTGAAGLMADGLTRDRGAIAGVSRGGPDHGGVDAGHAAAAPRGGGAADGAGGGGGGEESRPRPRRVPDGGGVRRGVRLPDADRASEQHAGDGTGRLPVQRLLAAGTAAVDPGGGVRDRR